MSTVQPSQPADTTSSAISSNTPAELPPSPASASSARFTRPVPLAVGFDAIEAYLGGIGRSPADNCGAVGERSRAAPR